MSKPDAEVQFVFMRHAREENDMQDRLFDKIFPAFFEPDALNILGIENAGSYIDEQRIRLFQRAKRDPIQHAIPFPLTRQQPPWDPIKYLATYIHGVYHAQGFQSIGRRELTLLRRWNEQHTDSVVLPYHESYETPEIRDAVADIGKKVSSIIAFQKDGMRDMVQFCRDRDELTVSSSKERDDNWVRILKQLMEIAVRMGKTRLRVLVTLGPTHFQIPQKLKKQHPDAYKVRPSIFLPDSTDYLDADGIGIQCRMMTGEIASDEEYIRVLYYKTTILFLLLQKAAADPSTLFSIDRDYLKEFWGKVKCMSIDEIMQSLPHNSDEDAAGSESNDNPLHSDPIDGLDNITIHRYVSSDPLPEKLDAIFIDRSNHPNNIWLDRFYVSHAVAAGLDIQDAHDPVINLIGQALDALTASGIWTMKDFRRDCYSIAAEMENDAEASFLTNLLKKIAGQNTDDPTLWTDDSKNHEASRRLVELVRKLTGTL